MYRVEASFDEIFEENAAFLRRLGVIEESAESAGRLCAGAERATLDFLAGLLRPYLEGYGLVAEALLELDRASPGAPVDRQALVKAAMERGRAAYASGRVALRESLSKATFENAAEWLVQQGALEPDGGHSRLTSAWRDGRLPETVRQIRDCLRA
jgi:glycerol-3-phosphate O-acyltransferase